MCRASTRQYKNTNICPLHSIKIRFETSLCNGVFKCCPILICTPILPIFINLRPLESRFPGRMSKVINLMSLFTKKTNHLGLMLISPTTCYINLCHILVPFFFELRSNAVQPAFEQGFILFRCRHLFLPVNGIFHASQIKLRFFRHIDHVCNKFFIHQSVGLANGKYIIMGGWFQLKELTPNAGINLVIAFPVVIRFTDTLTI